MGGPGARQSTSGRPGFLGWMGSLWGYTILRFGMFFALWGLLLLAGLGGLLGALLALVLSIPLSLVLLAGPRARVAQNIERRVDAARAARRNLDAQLEPQDHDGPAAERRDAERRDVERRDAERRDAERHDAEPRDG